MKQLRERPGRLAPSSEDRYVGGPVIAVFDNLLPDNDAIRKPVAARHQANGTDAYSLLFAIGRDCVGALQFLPEIATWASRCRDGNAAIRQEDR